MLVGLPDTKDSTRLPAYTSAVFSETRYATNRDLRVTEGEMNDGAVQHEDRRRARSRRRQKG